jgi:hypothetical protein
MVNVPRVVAIVIAVRDRQIDMGLPFKMDHRALKGGEQARKFHPPPKRRNSFTVESPDSKFNAARSWAKEHPMYHEQLRVTGEPVCRN